MNSKGLVFDPVELSFTDLRLMQFKIGLVQIIYFFKILRGAWQTKCHEPHSPNTEPTSLYEDSPERNKRSAGQKISAV